MAAEISFADDDTETRLLEAASWAARLGELLEQEFAALKARDLDAFDGLQEEKTELLTQLSALADRVAQMAEPPAAWSALGPSLAASRDAHQRNASLLQKMLQAVRGTLQAMHGDSGQALDLYDNMGKVSRRLGAFGVHIA